ncbi:MAG: hypothetical protein JWO02_2447 [Solirubrobacterales bacterium]|nr:hypothetical protein [Solirubrobacterales bacterium]
MFGASDPSRVPSSYDPLGCLSLDRLVERFAVARDHGDDPTARQLWGAIAVKLDDRLKVFVRAFVIPRTAGERLGRDDRDEAFQRARKRVWFKLGATFRGVSVGELHNAARTATWYACADVARERMKQEQRSRRARKAPGDDHDDLDRLSRAQATRTFERAVQVAELKDELDRAMARMKNPSHREVLMLDRLGVPDDEIAQRLGITTANVYQRRKRGLTNLKELLNDAPA